MSPGMSVEVVAVVVNIKTLKKLLIDCTQARDRVVRGRGDESRNEEESCRLVCTQVSLKDEASCWIHQLNKEDYSGHCTR